MRLDDVIHPSWEPVRAYLNMEPLYSFNREVLPVTPYVPDQMDIFNVFSMPLGDIRVVILGQDPYPRPGDANGHAFSVNHGTPLPYSLKRILSEMTREFPGIMVNQQQWGTLEHLSAQGVFLLNTALTTRKGEAGSHLREWEGFTKRVIEYICLKNPCIWMLWGQKAQSFIPCIYHNPYTVKKGGGDIPYGDYNYILKSAHPAADHYNPVNSFHGCGHFSMANKILKHNRLKEISWLGT